MKEKIIKIFSIAVFLLLALLFVAKFSGAFILRLYVERGVGNCEKLPILCMAPEEEIVNPVINKEYIAELLPYTLPEMGIQIPKGFNVVKERITKVYYKKKKRKDTGAIFYLLYEEPNFFVNLFPQLNKKGIKNDYEFFKRIMYAKAKDIKNLTDSFFVISKGIFIPNLGDQKNIKMIKFTSSDKGGFINYNLSDLGNYFDCNVFNNQGDFFKIYIKDKDTKLDLDKVLSIISTVKKLD